MELGGLVSDIRGCARVEFISSMTTLVGTSGDFVVQLRTLSQKPCPDHHGSVQQYRMR